MKRGKKREELYSLLGDLPNRQATVYSKLISKEEMGDIVVERLILVTYCCETAIKNKKIVSHSQQ